MRAANEKQQQKRKRSHRQLAYTGGLSIQEARGLVHHENEAQEASTTIPVGGSELLRQQTNHLYGHHHGAVIVVLLGIEDCNVLIAMELSSIGYVHFSVVLLNQVFRPRWGSGRFRGGRRSAGSMNRLSGGGKK